MSHAYKVGDKVWVRADVRSVDPTDPRRPIEALASPVPWAEDIRPDAPAMTDADVLRALLAEAADEIEAVITAQYAGMEHYPSERRRKARDMAIVRRIRAALAAHGTKEASDDA